MNIAGYDQNMKQNLKGTFVVNYKIKQIQGLSAKAFINYEQNYQDDKNFTKPYDFYTYDATSQIYSLAGSLGTQARLVLQNNEYRNLTGQLSLNYDRTFGADQRITALALYEVIDYSTNYVLAGRQSWLLTVKRYPNYRSLGALTSRIVWTQKTEQTFVKISIFPTTPFHWRSLFEDSRGGKTVALFREVGEEIHH